MNVRFQMPTRVETGVRANAAALGALGQKALVVTGRRSAKLCGALDDLTAALEENGQSFVLFDRVPANPTVDCVYAGAALARETGCDCVVAIGGGSPMDAGKAIALLAAKDIPAAEIFKGGYDRRLPLCCIPTTAGTGSEVTQYAILTNDAAQTKTSLAAPALFPDLALLDPRYLAKVPRATLVNTALDSLSHSAEGYLSAKAGPISDALALEALGVLGMCLPALGRGAPGPEVLENLLYASTLGGMAIAHTGTTAVHAMGYSLTYFREIDHGRANALLLPAFLRFLCPEAEARVGAVLTALGFDGVDAFSAALNGLLGARETLTQAEVVQFAAIAAQAGNLKNCPKPPNEGRIRALYRASFGLEGGEGA